MRDRDRKVAQQCSPPRTHKRRTSGVFPKLSRSRAHGHDSREPASTVCPHPKIALERRGRELRTSSESLSRRIDMARRVLDERMGYEARSGMQSVAGGHSGASAAAEGRSAKEEDNGLYL